MVLSCLSNSVVVVITPVSISISNMVEVMENNAVCTLEHLSLSVVATVPALVPAGDEFLTVNTYSLSVKSGEN